MQYTDIFQAINDITAQQMSLTLAAETCSPSAMLSDVTKLMAQKNIGSIIVTENETPIGVFTERDLLKKVVAEGMNVNATPISAVMTRNPVCITMETPLLKMMAAMRLGKFRHLIVVDANKKIVGVISIKDILSQVTDLLVSYAQDKPGLSA